MLATTHENLAKQAGFNNAPELGPIEFYYEDEVARTFVPKQSVKLTTSYAPEWLSDLTIGTFVE